jgi:hypothetical protein
MKVIRFFSSFAPPQGCIEAYTRTSELTKSPLFNTEYRFTCSDDYTHAIILNTAMPKLSIPKENVVGVAFEPTRFLNITPAFVEYAKKYIGRYYIGENKNLPSPLFTEHFGFMWHLTPLTVIPDKTSVMAIICSEKVFTNNHRYRHELVKRILNTKLPIDIWGRGCQYYHKYNDSRLKGVFDNDEYPHSDYTYSICIENDRQAHYFSEKIMNPLLCNSIPIYYGCTNIESYFPNQIIHLTGKIDEDMTLLSNICNNPDTYKKIIDIDQVKKTISVEGLFDMFPSSS